MDPLDPVDSSHDSSRLPPEPVSPARAPARVGRALGTFVSVASGGVLVAAVAAGILALGNWTAGVKAREVTPAPPAAAADALPPAASANGLRMSFADILAPAERAVVNIQSTKTARNQPRPRSHDEEMFRRFFGFPSPDAPEDRESESMGSGVVVRADGIILTNNHVVADADEVLVKFSDQRKVKAKVVGTDPPTDVAVLKVEEKDLPVLPIGRSADLRVGDIVFAIGSPFGLGGTATMGIVSATGRHGLDIAEYEDFIQTDASINPGNSGGPLIDSRGQLVGINTAIFSRGMPGNIGLGFAVPVDIVRGVMDQILAGGKVVRAQLGVSVQEILPDMVKPLGLESAKGALVASVLQDSPAEKAGIKPGDVIVELDGNPVNTQAELPFAISGRKPGSKAEIGVLRKGKHQTFDVVLAEKKDKDAEEESAAASEDEGTLRGVAVSDAADLSTDERRQLDLPPGSKGVVVTDVEPRSPAGKSGLKPGDVIREVNREPVENLAEYKRRLRAVSDDAVLLLVRREGADVFLVIQP